MKKLSVLLLVFLLVGCRNESMDLLTEEVKDVKADIEALDDEVNRLESERLRLTETIDDLNVLLDNQVELNKLLSERITDSNTVINDFITDYTNKTHDQDSRDYMLDLSYDLSLSNAELERVNGLVETYDESSRIITIDTFEFVAYYDDERIDELNIDRNDPIIAGAYFYNGDEAYETYELADNFMLYVYDWPEDHDKEPTLLQYPLMAYMAEKDDFTRSFDILLLDGKIIRMVELFLN